MPHAGDCQPRRPRPVHGEHHGVERLGSQPRLVDLQVEPRSTACTQGGHFSRHGAKPTDQVSVHTSLPLPPSLRGLSRYPVGQPSPDSCADIFPSLGSLHLCFFCTARARAFPIVPSWSCRMRPTHTCRTMSLIMRGWLIAKAHCSTMRALGLIVGTMSPTMSPWGHNEAHCSRMPPRLNN